MRPDIRLGTEEAPDPPCGPLAAGPTLKGTSMSGPANSPEGEDVLASIRRIVSEEASAGRLRLTAEMEAPGKLVLSPALRSGEAPSLGAAERGLAGGAPRMRLETPVAETGTTRARQAPRRTPETSAGNGRAHQPERAEVPEAEFVHADDGFPWTGEVLEFRSDSGRSTGTAEAEAGADGSAARRDDVGREAPAGSRSRDGFFERGMQDSRQSRASDEPGGRSAKVDGVPGSRANSGESAFGPPRNRPDARVATATPSRSESRENREREPRQAERDRSATRAEPKTAGREEQEKPRRPRVASRSGSRCAPAAERSAEGRDNGFVEGEARRLAQSRDQEAPFRDEADCRDNRSSDAGENGPPGRGQENLFVPNEEALRALAARIIREELLGVPNERLEDDMRRIVRQEVRRALLGRDRN